MTGMFGKSLKEWERQNPAPEIQVVPQDEVRNLPVANFFLPVGQSMDLGPQFGVVYQLPALTPAMAKQLLGRVPDRQRKCRANRVAAMVRALEEGDYKWTGEPIRLDPKDHLVDGQHRVTAIADSGVTVYNMLLVVMADPLAVAYIDEGLVRNVQDRRRILGKDTVGSGVQAAIIFESQDFLRGGSAGTTLDNREKDALLDNFVWLEEVHAWHTKAKKTYGRYEAPNTAAMIRCMRHNYEGARMFFDAATANQHMIRGTHCMPLEALCNHFIREAGTRNEKKMRAGHSQHERELVEKVIRAFNAFRQGRDLNRLAAQGRIPEVV